MDDHSHLPRTVFEAHMQNSILYFTGRPCKNGHFAPRTLNGNCTECRYRHDSGRQRTGKKTVNKQATIPGARFVAGRCQTGSK